MSRQKVRSDRSYLHVSVLQPMLHVTCQRLCTPLAASVLPNCTRQSQNYEEGFSRNVPQVARIGIVVDPGDASFLIADPIKGSREESV